jgi:hypothetical protein
MRIEHRIAGGQDWSFQWLRAGWSRINFVKPGHILGGLERFARVPNDSGSLLPALVDDLTYRLLSNMPALTIKNTLPAASNDLWPFSSVKSANRKEEHPSFANTPKEQMVEELIWSTSRRRLVKIPGASIILLQARSTSSFEC